MPDGGPAVSTEVQEETPSPTRRGSDHSNVRGSSIDRRRRRAFLMVAYAANIPGFVRCYRCGCLLFNPDAPPCPVDADTGYIRPTERQLSLYGTQLYSALSLTIDRIVPGCMGGRYVRNNIRPACGPCNSETGGALSRSGGKK